MALVLSMLLSTGVSLATDPSPWAEKQVAEAIEYGLVPENLRSDYQEHITREEFAELALSLYESFSSEAVSEDTSIVFKDTDNKKVLIAAELGIVNGVGNDRFAPEENITREQISTMIYRTLMTLNSDIDLSDRYISLENFQDSRDISVWARDGVEFMVGMQIMIGIGEDIIAPLGITTKEQAILLVFRAFVNPHISDFFAPEIEILGADSLRELYLIGDEFKLDIALKSRKLEREEFWIGCSLMDPLGKWVDIEPVKVNIMTDSRSRVTIQDRIGEWLTGKYAVTLSVWDSDPSIPELESTRIDQFKLENPIGIYRGVDYFESWNEEFWTKRDGAIGQTRLNPENILLDESGLRIKMPKNKLEGGEIQTRRNQSFGSYEVSMKLPNAPSSITGFFLYRAPDFYHEIDIEIFNQPNSQLWLTTYENGKEVNEYKEPLWFDPTADYHRYRIDYYQDKVSFYIDDRHIQTWTDGFSKRPMRLMLNSWYPTWLDGVPPRNDTYLDVEWIRY